MVNNRLMKVFVLIVLVTVNASAARIGVLVDFPDGTVKTECVEVIDNANGYEVMEKTSLELLWAGPSAFGHALCRIDGVGDDVSGDYCEYSGKYWGFFIAENGVWSYMPVGWDAGDSCWSGDPNSYEGHYCAKDGDVLGYRYGEFGVMPAYRGFSEICPTKKKTGGEREVVFEWSGRRMLEEDGTLHTQVNEVIELTLKDERTGEIVEDASTDVRDSKLKKLFTVEAEDDGKIRIHLDKEGEYRLLVMPRNYAHTQVTVTVEKQETTTSSSSTTTVTQTTTSTSTTTKLPHFLSIEKENVESTTSTTTTIQETTSTTLTVPAEITGKTISTDKRGSNTKMAVIIAFVFISLLLLTKRR